MLVRRGFPKPPTYHDDRLRNAPVGHFFDVMTNGWGKMNSYAAQVSPADRWAIASYIRTLQIAQDPDMNLKMAGNANAANSILIDGQAVNVAIVGKHNRRCKPMSRPERFYAPEELKRWRAITLGVGGIGSIIILGTALLFPDMREQALRSWLLGFVFWAGIGIGCLGSTAYAISNGRRVGRRLSAAA